MIKINLLPPEYEEAQKKKEVIMLGGGAGVILICVLTFFWFIQKSRAAALEGKIRQSEADLQTFQTIIGEINQIEADKKRKEEKLNVIKSLNRSRLIYPVLFEDFIPIVPADVWITNMALDEKGDSIKITMSCRATSNFAVATWLTNLQQSPHFSGINLGSISYSRSEQSTTLSFSLDCSYQHRGPLPLSEYY